MAKPSRELVEKRRKFVIETAKTIGRRAFTLLLGTAFLINGIPGVAEAIDNMQYSEIKNYTQEEITEMAEKYGKGSTLATLDQFPDVMYNGFVHTMKSIKNFFSPDKESNNGEDEKSIILRNDDNKDIDDLVKFDPEEGYMYDNQSPENSGFTQEENDGNSGIEINNGDEIQF